MIAAIWTVHTAAPPVGWVQCCGACGFVLQDNTAWAEGRVAVRIEDEGCGPSWWPTGQRIGTDKVAGEYGGCTFVLEDGRPLEPDERLCAGTN